MNCHPVILHASMSGNSRDCAHLLGRHLHRHGHRASVIDLACYDAGRIFNEQTVYICIGTGAEGEPPEDGAAFVEFLRFLNADTLAHLHYALLALGEAGDPDFCQCGRDLDALLQYLGATRIVPRVDCDADCDAPAQAWARSIVAALKPAAKAA